MCSSDSDAQENLKKAILMRGCDKVYTAFKELFSIVNMNSMHEILSKINEYNSEIAKFVQDVNIKYGMSLNYTQIKHWV